MIGPNEVYPNPFPENTYGLRRSVETVKQDVRIEAVARDYDYGDFKMVGNNRLLGRCLSPEHEDKTPSLTIYIGTQTFKCYGCGEHGDVVDLVRLAEGGRLWESVVSLSVRYGIELPGRPESWYGKQQRQAPVRDVLDEMRVRRVRRRLMRWIVAPEIETIPDLDERAREADTAWRELLPIARQVVAEVQDEAGR